MPNSIYLSRRVEKFLSNLCDAALYSRLRAAIEINGLVCVCLFDELSRSDQFGFQRPVCREPAHLENGKADDLAVIVDALHHGIIRGFTHAAGPVREGHLGKITFFGEPNFHFVGHICSPFFGLSVRYAVKTNASFSPVFSHHTKPFVTDRGPGIKPVGHNEYSILNQAGWK